MKENDSTKQPPATELRDLFVVSDVHAHARELFAALDAAGFDRNDPRHLLVCGGDYFDRGRESMAIYRYLRVTPNKILLRGNHEYLLEDVIARGFLRPLDARNGMEHTVTALFGRDCLDSNGRLYADPEDMADVLRFTSEMYDYFESAHYRFVHGWVPLAIDELGETSAHASWQTATREEWRRACWTEWQQVYQRRDELLPHDKILVCGHRTSAYGSFFDPSRQTNDYSTFHGDGLIAIDAQTVTSGRVNVLVLRDEPIRVPAVHEMRLQRVPFEAIKSGKKRVEMRTYDEKRRTLQPRDTIRFVCEESGENLSVTVLGIHVYPDFAALCDDFDPADLGFPSLTREAISAYMAQFYPPDLVHTNGALAIRFLK